MHQRALCALRSTVWLTDCKSLGLGRVRSTDRELGSLVGNNGRSTGRLLSPTIENPTVGDRSTDRKIFFCIFPNDYTLFCLFLGLFPMTLLGLLLIFSSPINSGTIKNSTTRFLKFRSSFYKFTSSFSFFLKGFSIESKLHILDF